MYAVIDIKTNIVHGTYKTLKSARRVADRLDSVYGAVRYNVKRAEG